MEADKQKQEEVPLVEDPETIQEQKEYSAVAEVLAESFVVVEGWWHATVNYVNTFDERLGVSQKAWNKTAEVSSKAMENPYVATAVTKVTEGVELATTIYAQTLELIDEKRRSLAGTLSPSSSSASPADEGPVLVAVHTNYDELYHTEQQAEDQSTSNSAQPGEALTIDVQVNPTH